MEIVQKYTVDFHNVLNTFNALPPTIEPSATGHIVEQIEITQDLINKGLAYEVNGSVYFDEEAYNKKGLNYGELSRSEEHTSELQSRGHLVCRLLLEKKKIT